MTFDRKTLNRQQTALRRLLGSGADHERALSLFLRHNAMLHTAEVSGGELWSYADEILGDLSAAQFRRIPPNEEHSVAWCIWHIARIEDVTMNLLVAGSPQLLHQEGWGVRLKVSAAHTGNAMTAEEIAEFSAAVHLEALHAYRAAVGRRTRTIVAGLLLMPASRHLLVHLNEAGRLKRARAAPG